MNDGDQNNGRIEPKDQAINVAPASSAKKDSSPRNPDLYHVPNSNEQEDEKQAQDEPVVNESPEDAPHTKPVDSNQESSSEPGENIHEVKDLNFVEKFFGNHWNVWINKTKFIILPIVTIWIAIALWRTASLESATEAVKNLPDGHWLLELEDTLANDFHRTADADSLSVYLVWGIDRLDRSGINRWKSTDLGKIVYDDDFDMSSETNQQRLLDICDDLKINDLVHDEQVECWVQDFVDAQNGGSPVAQADFYTELETYIDTDLGQDQFNENLIGYIDGELKFIRIKALTDEDLDQGFSDMNPVYEDWEDLKDFYNNGSPTGINNAFQSAGYPWAWLVTQQELVDGAIQGIAISIGFAFCVLVISTLNILAALYSILCIACIIISVICTMELSGWTLGVLEAISMVIIVGFSVDYVVHLANHYVESVYTDRFRKMKDALTGIGISIISGAITTIGSGIFMFLATILFFQKFAALVLSVILFSLFFSLVLFVSINHWIGPSGNCGNLKHYLINPAIAKLKSCCKKTKDNESEEADEKEVN